MAIKKSQLYSSLWESCDEPRGGMDASQYKDYVLTLLFMKYVSDRYAGKADALIEVPAGGGFADMVKLKGDKEIGDKINKIIGRLAEANDLKGVIDQADFNDEAKLGGGKEMQDRLSRLVAIFDALDFRANRAEGDDLLGDAYEYLMRHIATESGKSKGQFYTPAEVSRVMAKVVGIGPGTSRGQTIYDPTCGSGSLLHRWYRQRLREQVAGLIARWEPVLGVRVADWRIRKMKTRWGSCNAAAGRIWLNLELAKKRVNCTEYVLVHEMVHLLERRHDERFRGHMDRFLPQWRLHRDALNRAPLAHEDWAY
jgi:hypothetical protein